MNKPFQLTLLLSLCLLLGCASALPAPQKPFTDQATWQGPSREKVYGACLTALTLANIAVHPTGTSQEGGLIVTRPRGRHIPATTIGSVATFWHYALQMAVFETPDGKVMVSATAVDVGYNGTPPGPELTEMRRYFNDSIATDLDNVFRQLDSLLGKAESSRPGQAPFPLAP